MAIEVIVGNVGSGKTYFATYRIWQEIKKIYEAEQKGVEYKYKRIYTNIEGIKPNKYVKIIKVKELINIFEEELKVYKDFESQTKAIKLVDELKKIRESGFKIENNNSLEDDDLETHFINYDDPVRKWESEIDKMLHDIALVNEDVEEEFIRITKPKFKEYGFTDCLFVIDEAHNFFKFLSPGALRMFTYHRHYDMDFLLITQDLRQLDRRLLGVTEKVIKAVNPTLRASKDFKYKVYSGGYISNRDTNLIDRITLKADPDIFNLYNSGGTKQSKSYLLKLLATPLMLISFVIIGYIALINYFPKFLVQKTQHKTVKHKKKKEKEKIKWKDLQVTSAGDFVIYKGQKYDLDTFNAVLMKCGARLNRVVKNLDSSITYFYKIKDIKCLENSL